MRKKYPKACSSRGVLALREAHTQTHVVFRRARRCACFLYNTKPTVIQQPLTLTEKTSKWTHLHLCTPPLPSTHRYVAPTQRKKHPKACLYLIKGCVRITQVFLNLIRRVHCVSPPSFLCLQLCLHLVSVHNFYVIGGAGNVRKFACRTQNRSGSNEYCEKAMNGAKKR